MASNEIHLEYMRQALAEARKSPPKPTNYCVGAVLVDVSNNKVLSTGYTLELEGNTHAEQCALAKYASTFGLQPDQVGDVLPPQTAIYTTMEPCNFRLSGNAPCADRIVGAKNIREVYVGVQEPEKFVGQNEGRKKLEEQGIRYIHVSGLEKEILAVATAGHPKSEESRS